MRCRRGTAAVEMALVTPLLIAVMLGSFEAGNFYLDSHVVAKAVRDGARYAARRAFANYSACSGAPGGTVVTDTRNIVRTGQLSGGTARLPGWTDPATISISISCNTAGVGGVAYTGIYTGMATGAPVVTVSAAVPYQTLFGEAGFSSSTLTLRAESQAAVAGI
ncbi:TadE/TadG family type IV pilus assembly protein [Sphingomonas sp. YR710]|uniref:TadE/TadG family type IV pilus assembly protein n=1 Tax=Sphingomonas sp. YR710 TaxID=1882773 RepID=UPI00210E2106|nr:TadE family protein [Sphingomonas sp. YR710]